MAHPFGLGQGLRHAVGLAPIVHAGRIQPATALGQARATPRARDRARASLIVAQMALALVLLIGAGLLVRTYARLTSVNLGFRPEGVVTISVAFAASHAPARRAMRIDPIVALQTE